MKNRFIIVCFCIILIICFFSGCAEIKNAKTSHDVRLIGQWENAESHELLTFFNDGTYSLEEGEIANWSTDNAGKLSMYNNLYSYSISENNTNLILKLDSVTKIYHRL